MINIERVYDHEAAPKGYKIFIDRLWPRGISKENAPWNLWIKEVAPSNELRKWFNHDPQKWAEFQSKYVAELKIHTEETVQIAELQQKHGDIVLLYGAKDTQHNNAVVLRDYLINLTKS